MLWPFSTTNCGCLYPGQFVYTWQEIFTSNGDLRRKQSNHKTDESMKIGQSVGFFGWWVNENWSVSWVLWSVVFIRDTPLSQKNYRVYKKKKFDPKTFFNQKMWQKNMFLTFFLTKKNVFWPKYFLDPKKLFWIKAQWLLPDLSPEKRKCVQKNFFDQIYFLYIFFLPLQCFKS